MPSESTAAVSAPTDANTTPDLTPETRPRSILQGIVGIEGTYATAEPTGESEILAARRRFLRSISHQQSLIDNPDFKYTEGGKNRRPRPWWKPSPIPPGGTAVFSPTIGPHPLDPNGGMLCTADEIRRNLAALAQQTTLGRLDAHIRFDTVRKRSPKTGATRRSRSVKTP